MIKKNKIIKVDKNLINEFIELLEKGEFKNNLHMEFAFSYNFLITYLWKYAKYGEKLIDTKKIKEILGTNKTYTGYDYIIKRNGVLDISGITETTRDFPIAYDYNEELKYVQLLKVSDLGQEGKDYLNQLGKRFSVKKPVYIQNKINKNIISVDNSENSFDVSLDEFSRCINNNKIGTGGFLLYCYLKKNILFYKDKKNCNFKTTYPQIRKDIKVSQERACSIIKELIKEKLIIKKNIGLNINGSFCNLSSFELYKK